MYSPDPTCNINLNSIKNIWIFDLPILLNRSQAVESGWNEYLQNVYGSLDFPIDLRCKTFFWKNKLPENKKIIFKKHYKYGKNNIKNGDVIDLGTKKEAWFVYLYENLNFETNTFINGNYYNYSDKYILKPAKNNNWVEIYHDYSDCGSNNKVQAGFWGHYAPGSGVFANVKNTIITDGVGYKKACKSLSNSSNCNLCCSPAHEVLRNSAVKHGYSSLQSCCGRRGGDNFNTFEITFFEDKCPQKNMCPNNIKLKTGYNHNRDCICNTNKTTINCL